MIQYANRGAKAYLALLVCMKGSVVPSALPPAIMSTGLSLALALTHNSGEDNVPDLMWAHHAFAIQIYAIILGFLIVTRSNMALARYTSAMEGLQVMISKWLDAYMQLCSFVNAHLEKDERAEPLLAWREKMAHWFSLMATFAVASLRGDENQPEFSPAHRGSRMSAGDGDDVVRLKTRASGMFIKRRPRQHSASSAAGSSSLSGALKEPMRRPAAPPQAAAGPDDAGAAPKGLTRRALTTSFAPRVTLKAVMANAGVEALGDLISSMSAMGRSDACTWPHDVDVGDAESRNHLEYLGHCTDGERAVLSQVHDKVLVVSGWITESITRAVLRNRPNAPEGPALKVPPPVVSRVYQEMSNGMQAYHHAMMVVIVPFPFPFAQMLTYLLFGFSFLAPFMVLQFTRSVIFSPILTFVAVFGYIGTDCIAKEIENPFGEDTNDLPLLGMHKDYNNSIRELLLPLPHLGDFGAADWEEAQGKTAQHSEFDTASSHPRDSDVAPRSEDLAAAGKSSASEPSVRFKSLECLEAASPPRSSARAARPEGPEAAWPSQLEAGARPGESPGPSRPGSTRESTRPGDPPGPSQPSNLLVKAVEHFRENTGEHLREDVGERLREHTGELPVRENTEEFRRRL